MASGRVSGRVNECNTTTTTRKSRMLRLEFLVADSSIWRTANRKPRTHSHRKRTESRGRPYAIGFEAGLRERKYSDHVCVRDILDHERRAI